MSQIFDVSSCRTEIYRKLSNLPPNFQPMSSVSTDFSRKNLCNRSNNGNSEDSPFHKPTSIHKTPRKYQKQNSLMAWLQIFYQRRAFTRFCSRHDSYTTTTYFNPWWKFLCKYLSTQHVVFHNGNIAGYCSQAALFMDAETRARFP